MCTLNIACTRMQTHARKNAHAHTHRHAYKAAFSQTRARRLTEYYTRRAHSQCHCFEGEHAPVSPCRLQASHVFSQALRSVPSTLQRKTNLAQLETKACIYSASLSSHNFSLLSSTPTCSSNTVKDYQLSTASSKCLHLLGLSCRFTLPFRCITLPFALLLCLSAVVLCLFAYPLCHPAILLCPFAVWLCLVVFSHTHCFKYLTLRSRK